MFTITADTLDQALADISDVPTVAVDATGSPSITFTGNYENPVNDLVTFLLQLGRGVQREKDGMADAVMEAVRDGLYWDDTAYGGSATLTLNSVRLDGTSRYQERCPGEGPFDCSLPLDHDGECDLSSS